MRGGGHGRVEARKGGAADDGLLIKIVKTRKKMIVLWRARFCIFVSLLLRNA